MSWNIGDNRKLFLKLECKLRLYHIVLTPPKTSPEKLTLTVVEMQQMPHIAKTDSKKELSCLKRTICNGRRKVCVNFHSDTDKLNVFVYRYRNKLYIKGNESWSGIDRIPITSGKKSLYLELHWHILQAVHYKRMKQLVIIKTNSVKNGCSFPLEHFTIVPENKNVIWTT